MKKIFSILLALVLINAVVFAGGAKETQSNGLTIKEGVLSVGMEIGYPPFEYYEEDGKTPTGFDVMMGKAIAEKLGLKVEFIDTAWDGIFAGVNTNKYDVIISGVTYTEERAAVHNFTKPYIGNAQAMVLLKDTAVTAKAPTELTGLSVAYQAETTSDIFVTKLIDDGLTIETFEYDKVMNCFDDLKNKRCDAVVCDSMVAIDYINQENSPYEIVWLGESDEVMSICLKKGNDELTAKIDAALDELFADGTMLKISNTIFGMDMVSSMR